MHLQSQPASSLSCSSYLVAKRLLLGKIKAAIGLDQCIFCISGAAPISNAVLDYFSSLDIDILEVYGMSESSGGTTVGTPSIHKTGTVGTAIGPIEVKADHVHGRDREGDGEQSPVAIHCHAIPTLTAPTAEPQPVQYLTHRTTPSLPTSGTART